MQFLSIRMTWSKRKNSPANPANLESQRIKFRGLPRRDTVYPDFKFPGHRLKFHVDTQEMKPIGHRVPGKSVFLKPILLPRPTQLRYTTNSHPDDPANRLIMLADIEPGDGTGQIPPVRNRFGCRAPEDEPYCGPDGKKLVPGVKIFASSVVPKKIIERGIMIGVKIAIHLGIPTPRAIVSLI